MSEIRCETCNKEFNKSEDLAMHNSAKHNIPLRDNLQGKVSGMSKKTIFLIFGILAVILIGYFLIAKGGLTGNATSENIQKITLSMKNYNYYPNIITVEADKPVEITLDSSVRGCYRSFNIKELGVSQYSQDPSQKITFTPSQKGSFEFACSMRMGRGTIVVN